MITLKNAGKYKYYIMNIRGGKGTEVLHLRRIEEENGLRKRC